MTTDQNVEGDEFRYRSTEQCIEKKWNNTNRHLHSTALTRADVFDFANFISISSQMPIF